jgi:hypothetical protein
MCHGIRVRLTPDEEKEVKKLWGVVAPVYASLALVIVGAIALANLPRSDESIVAKSTPPAAVQPTER